MKQVLAAVAVTVAAVALASGPADAKRYKSQRSYQDNDERVRESNDRIRANSLDPTGELKYPDWARKALAPKGSGGRPG